MARIQKMDGIGIDISDITDAKIDEPILPSAEKPLDEGKFDTDVPAAFYKGILESAAAANGDAAPGDTTVTGVVGGESGNASVTFVPSSGLVISSAPSQSYIEDLKAANQAVLDAPYNKLIEQDPEFKPLLDALGSEILGEMNAKTVLADGQLRLEALVELRNSLYDGSIGLTNGEIRLAELMGRSQEAGEQQSDVEESESSDEAVSAQIIKEPKVASDGADVGTEDAVPAQMLDVDEDGNPVSPLRKYYEDVDFGEKDTAERTGRKRHPHKRRAIAKTHGDPDYAERTEEELAALEQANLKVMNEKSNPIDVRTMLPAWFRADDNNDVDDKSVGLFKTIAGITWPNARETASMSVAVLIGLIFAMAVVLGLDTASIPIVDWLAGLRP